MTPATESTPPRQHTAKADKIAAEEILETRKRRTPNSGRRWFRQVPISDLIAARFIRDLALGEIVGPQERSQRHFFTGF